MSRRPALSIFPILMTLLALLMLRAVVTSSDGLAFSREPELVISATLITVIIAFTTVVEVPLQGAGLSLGYSAGLLAVLVLGEREDLFTVIGIIGAGGLLGGVIRALWRDWQQQRRPGLQTLAWALVASSQLILSFSVGALIYGLLGGALPLTMLTVRRFPALVVLVSTSMIVYVALYAFTLYWRQLSVRRIFRDNFSTLLLALLAPVPFAITGALVVRASLVGFTILAAGLLALAFLATELGRQRLRFSQQVLELSSLSAMSRAMRANLELDALLETLHLQVATLLNVDTFTLALYDADRSLLYFPLVFRDGQRQTHAARPLNAGPIDYVIERKAGLMFAADAVQQAKARGLLPPDDNPAAWLGVPLLASDRALGCIAIASHDPARQFTADDKRLLTAIAAQGAISVDNAQLYRQTQERSRQLAALNELSARLSGTLDPQRVFDLVANSLLEIGGADGSAVFLWWDDTQQTLALARSAGVSDSFNAAPPLPLIFAEGVSAQVQPLTITNRRGEPRAEALAEAMEREGYSAWIELPLRNGTQVLGVLVAYYQRPQRFAAEAVELLRVFANQSALSISNARLYHRTDEALEQRITQLSALASINQELASTLNLQHLFTLVLDHALEGTRSTSGVLLLQSEAAGQSAPRIVAQRGQEIEERVERVESDERAKYVRSAARAFETNQFVVDRSSGLSELSVPITHDESVLGVITLQSKERDAYHPDEIMFVRQLATQAVIAIDNAQLFGRVEESRDRLQIILDSMHEAILLIDMTGTVLLANPQIDTMFDLPRITGQSVEALLAQPELDFAHQLGFEEDALRELIEDIQVGRWLGVNERTSYRVEKPMIRFIDRRMVSTHTSSGAMAGLLLVFSDATEERELTQAREDLTRMIVHDLRSPLTAISTSMRLLNELAPTDRALERILIRTTDASQRALRKLLGLVDSLLDIAKMESGNMALDLAEHMLAPIALGVRIELQPLAEELAIRVDLLIPDGLPRLYIDAPKIERVLLNLVDNALKFTPEEGVVRIMARVDPVQRGFVRVEVSDSGPGIPDDFKERIFDRFQQVDAVQGRRRGTGLGLTFCKLTIEAHGGHIWIEDNPAGGSIFAMTLPISNPAPVPLMAFPTQETARH